MNRKHILLRPETPKERSDRLWMQEQAIQAYKAMAARKGVTRSKQPPPKRYGNDGQMQAGHIGYPCVDPVRVSCATDMPGLTYRQWLRVCCRRLRKVIKKKARQCKLLNEAIVKT